MRNIFKNGLFLMGLLLATTTFAKDPTTTFDVATSAGANAYYTLDAVPNIKNLDWVGYNSTGSGSGGCITTSHWKLSSSRTLTFKVQNCQKVEAEAYFSKDATTNLKYSINGSTATSFNTNGTLKKTCATGDFLTNNTGEITIVISADNDVVLGEIKFYKAGGGGGGGGDVAVTSVSLDKTSTSLEVGQTDQLTATVLPNDATDKSVSWNSNPTSVATVSSTGLVTAVSTGTATITVTTTDGNKTATCTVTVTDGGSSPTPTPTPPPSTDLTLHQPEVYEASTTAGGYNTPLKVIGGREYEVYYANRTSESKASLTTTPGDKKSGIEDPATNTTTYCKANDGWMEATVKSISGGTSAKAAASGEFSELFDEWRIGATSVKIHVKGFDQFNYYAADKSVEKKGDGTFKKDQRFQVFIDGNMEPETQCSTDATVRRYTITTGEHVIEVKGMSGGESKFYAFSLRAAQEPRSKWMDGNDSTQIVYQTQEPMPVYYYTKYGHIAGAQTKLEFTGAKANGITLEPAGQDALGDTMVLAGTANCQTGVYTYNIVNYFNNVEVNRVSGKFQVATYIRSSSRDTVFAAYTGEPMDEISYSYIAMSGDSVHLKWKNNNAPTGVSGQANTSLNKFIISGTPTTAGTYDYTISVGGGNSLNGRLEVKNIDWGTNPIMYLYKNSLAYENDGVYKYLTSSAGGSLNLIPRTASNNGARADYTKYKWILISADVDADNLEVLALVRDNAANLPVLNMKGFTYSTGRLGWGEPNNGTMDTISKNGCNIYVMQPEHPIFNGINYDRATGKLQVLEKAGKQGVMPINVTLQGSLCLATGYTRNIEDYDLDGELQTIIHEVPVSATRNKNYICFPLANTKDNLTAQGKALLKNIVTYLTGTQHFSAMPELEMTSFSIDNYRARINQNEDLIELEMTKEQFEEADSLKAVVPAITVKNSKTHVVPFEGEELDLRYTTFLPKTFVVTDYINRRAYSFKLTVTKPQGIDEVYTAGQWINIFDIYGRKIATTNEDIYTMDLPHGIYLIVTETGNTIKLMK